MNISSKFQTITGRILMGLVLAALLGGVGVVSATANEDQRRGNERYEKRGPGYDRGPHAQGRRRATHPYGYRERVYVQPRVVYAPPPPPPPPGIGIFFPPIFFRP